MRKLTHVVSLAISDDDKSNASDIDVPVPVPQKRATSKRASAVRLADEDDDEMLDVVGDVKDDQDEQGEEDDDLELEEDECGTPPGLLALACPVAYSCWSLDILLRRFLPTYSKRM
jgi:hypothetical protein